MKSAVLVSLVLVCAMGATARPAFINMAAHHARILIEMPRTKPMEASAAEMLQESALTEIADMRWVEQNYTWYRNYKNGTQSVAEEHLATFPVPVHSPNWFYESQTEMGYDASELLHSAVMALQVLQREVTELRSMVKQHLVAGHGSMGPQGVVGVQGMQGPPGAQTVQTAIGTVFAGHRDTAVGNAYAAPMTNAVGL